MSRQETVNTTFGEFMDLISCLAIFNGAEPEAEKHDMTFDEILALR